MGLLKLCGHLLRVISQYRARLGNVPLVKDMGFPVIEPNCSAFVVCLKVLSKQSSDISALGTHCSGMQCHLQQMHANFRLRQLPREKASRLRLWSL